MVGSSEKPDLWHQSVRRYFSTLEEFSAFATDTKACRESVESWLSRRTAFDGYCDRCRRIRRMRVRAGAVFGERPNLREGLVCRCGLSNRQRLLYSAIKRNLAARDSETVHLLERHTKLFHWLQKTKLRVQGSEYLGRGLEPGSVHEVDGRLTVHQDLCDLSYDSNSIEMLVHGDVLEHIPDYERALKESFRVLRRDGLTVFTCPFFAIPDTVVRARYSASGELVHLEEPEYHGDVFRRRVDIKQSSALRRRLRSTLSEVAQRLPGHQKRGGARILAYYNFGWTLIDKLRTIGFEAVRVCVDYDLSRGLTSCNYPEVEGARGLEGFGNMLPLVIEAHKP